MSSLYAVLNLSVISPIVLPVSTGTVANSIALATVTPPWGSVFCHPGAHILNDECGAPEFFGDGLRLVPVDGEHGKLKPEAVEKAVWTNQGHGVHSYKASALSLTQATEAGTVYTADEVKALCDCAHALGMKTHMDGARFANAVVNLDCHPAEVTVEAGIDMLSFGASKNGCMSAEALVVFNQPQLRESMERQRKRGGHLLSKMRYVSAQLLAYIENDRWLEMARHANNQAAKFAQAVENHTGAELDLLIVRGRRRWGFEIKRTSSPTITPSMRSALSDLKLQRLFVVHAGSHSFEMADKIRAIALSHLFDELKANMRRQGVLDWKVRENGEVYFLTPKGMKFGWLLGSVAKIYKMIYGEMV